MTYPRVTTLAIGVVGGFTLGVVARAWMRLIAKHPHFTWSGTLGIVIGFTILGLGQSIVAIARQRLRRRWTFTVVRTIGIILMLPLFVAQGAVMFPTVIGSGLAAARTKWHPALRIVCLLLAAVPVAWVGHDIIKNFGYSRHSLAGVALMLGVYGTIVWATHFAFTRWATPRLLPASLAPIRSSAPTFPGRAEA